MSKHKELILRYVLYMFVVITNNKLTGSRSNGDVAVSINPMVAGKLVDFLQL